MWLKRLIQEISFPHDDHMHMICDNQIAIYIVSTPVFHKRAKHIEVDCHVVRETIKAKWISIPLIRSSDQLTYIFIKIVSSKVFGHICNKMEMIIYSPAIRKQVVLLDYCISISL